jgi:hypothetical protein
MFEMVYGKVSNVMTDSWPDGYLAKKASFSVEAIHRLAAVRSEWYPYGWDSRSRDASETFFAFRFEFPAPLPEFFRWLRVSF